MVQFSNAEKLDMICIYGEARRNAKEAVRIYGNRYPDRRLPSDKTFTSLAKSLAQNGCFNERKRKKQRTVTDEAHTVAVLGQMVLAPHSSTRQVAMECDISKSSIQRILSENKFHPYKIHLVQGLQPGDADRRLNFIAWLSTRIHDDDQFLNKILWSDESRFHNNGIVNKHNCHYWSDVNPHWIQETRYQTVWGVNVWCGIIDGYLIGPHFFEGILNGERYLLFLQHVLPNLLENLPIQTRLNMWWQQDGAPPHNNRIITQYLDDTFNEKWIGNKGPTPWPARSPDMTPLDFFCGDI